MNNQNDIKRKTSHYFYTINFKEFLSPFDDNVKLLNGEEFIVTRFSPFLQAVCF